MAGKNKKSNKLDELKVDPFDEFDEFDEDFTSIETEKDFFDEFDQSGLEDVPEYDSASGKIIETTESTTKTNDNVTKEVSKSSNVVETDSKNKTKTKNSKKAKSNTNKLNLSKKIKLPTPKVTVSKPSKKVKKLDSENTIKSDTKIIDNVKVDSEGVPLLNQFDTEKIKESTLFPRITINKISLSKILMIVLGLIITIIGILQAMNDVVKVSDHVMYGEHESIAFGLIFLGIIIIILAFYKELMKLAGLNNLTVMDEVESSSKPKNKKNKKSYKK